MSIIDRQMKLGRELVELNLQTTRRLVELQTSGVRQYFETNQEFAKRLPEVRDVASFLELQREYGQTLWNDAQHSLRENGTLLREAVEHTGKVLRTAFRGTEDEAVDAAPEAVAA